MFFRKQKQNADETIEMILHHDGCVWSVCYEDLNVSAATLTELDRKLEKALQPRLAHGTKLNVFMRTNNEIIPEWMRPFMNHYFNRVLELPLRY